MVRESQVVTAQLASAAADRDALREDLRGLHAQLAAAQQAVRARETEVEDVRKAYEVRIVWGFRSMV